MPPNRTRRLTRRSIGSTDVTFGDHTISFKAPFTRLSLREAARDAASRRLGTPVDAGELRSRETAAALAARLKVAIDPAMGPGKITAEIFEALCEATALLRGRGASGKHESLPRWRPEGF